MRTWQSCGAGMLVGLRNAVSRRRNFPDGVFISLRVGLGARASSLCDVDWVWRDGGISLLAEMFYFGQGCYLFRLVFGF